MESDHQKTRIALEAIRQSYDTLAEEYARRISGELENKPLDRELLDRFADRVKNQGDVCDLGCGPGHVARYLKDRGVTTFGVDLSPGNVRQAARLNPDMDFRVGDMLKLEITDQSLAGIAAFYSIVNLPRNIMTQVFREMFRVLKPEGQLLISFHVGQETTHYDSLWDLGICLDLVLFEPTEVKADLESAGFAVEEVIERDPYPEVEHPSRRAYIFAHRPNGPAKQNRHP